MLGHQDGVEGLISFVIVSRSGEDRREKRRQQAEARRLDQEHRGEARRGAGAGNMIPSTLSLG